MSNAAATRNSARPDSDNALALTARAQADAADPAACAWVSANAGTGKTHVLTRRVMRLLLAGTAPDRILCLTYTKAAAAEMSTRVFSTLGFWATYPDDKLAETLVDLLGRAPTDGEMALARTLFAAAIETPGGLKVQTIHSFSERLLQRFPLEAGVPPGFTILDDVTAKSLLGEAIEDTLGRATRAPASPLGRALRLAVAYAADDGFDDILGQALARRDWLEHVMRLTPEDDAGEPDAIDAIAPTYRAAFGVDAGDTAAGIDTSRSIILSDAQARHMAGVLALGQKTDNTLAAALIEATATTSATQRIAAFTRAFLTKDCEARSDRFITNAVRALDPTVAEALTRARDNFADLTRKRRSLDAIEATLALIRLADSVLTHYATLKARRAALDFDDLIRRAANLLATSGAAEWVLYKLDGGLDHILVDESQDTSPQQWRIVEALAGEFFSGAGNHETQPTIFAVGDEKQSIYSFQGARPEEFARMGDRFRAAASAANSQWRDIPLHLSFRTVAPILDAVDDVFASAPRTPGLTSRNARVAHAAHRIGQAGLVEIWETEKAEADADIDVWQPSGGEQGTSTDQRLAERIADRIAAMLDGEMLAAEGRPIRPGDVLILVRKRNPFARPMVAALKARGIPVAGADRLRLTEQLAVQDLMALGDFLTLPEDDLALATVLKSPLIGLDDDALLDIAHGRRNSLWKALLDARDKRPEYDTAAARLRDWRRRADFMPPYEFLASLLDRDGMRQRMLARLGPEAADSIDELINLAIAFDDGAPPSLTGFLSALRTADREIKRDMEHGRNEVRIMTVHGAKGLEAPIVFMPDTCSTRSVGRRPALYTLACRDLPIGAPDAFVWQVKGTSKLPEIAAGRAAYDEREREERNRLLYVAMTRARDRLYVCGFEARKKKRPPDSWYDLVVNGLDGKLTAVEDARGERVLRLASEQSVEIKSKTANDSTGPEAIPPPRDDPRALPEWALRPAPRESQLTMPLAPSRLAPYDTDDSGDPVSGPPPERGPGDEPPASPPRVLAAGNRFLRGTLTHALLEHLPGFPPESWAEAARAFVARRGLGLSTAARRSIVHETLAILKSPDLAILFGPDSRAEVAISALIPRPTGRGPSLRLTGQIDRLAIAGNSVFIIDYKTNRPPPASVEEVADAYLYQLAAYRLALAEMFPGRTLEASILWTDGPRRMPIPDGLLQRFEQKLWSIDPALIGADTT